MLRSFLSLSSDHPFSLHNLPYGIFSTPDRSPRVGVAIGEFILDLATLAERESFDLPVQQAQSLFSQPVLNFFMASPPAVWQAVRGRIQALLAPDSWLAEKAARERFLVPQAAATLHMPVAIGDYTDFYSSRQHAFNVGSMFRGAEHALLPNWRHLPVAYHGRASSVVVTGTPIRRPYGQILPSGVDTPIFAPSQRLDYELELGFLIGGEGNRLGAPIPVTEAADHIFGFVLVNDWSARDIQTWEYRPLGPFLAKNLGTSISAWVVPRAALEPFRVAGPAQTPQPLPYLQSREDWAYNIDLTVELTPADGPTTRLSRTNFRHMYWNVSQQIAHHTATGCNLRCADLLASGTISGETPDSYGSLLELSWGGTQPIRLAGGQVRTFLEDGDTVRLSGVALGAGYRVGFGPVEGRILPAEVA